MSSQGSRWNMLVIFSVCNLVFWIAVAAGIGIMASDIVDLGVESYLREKQATVVALGKQTPSPVTNRIPGSAAEVSAGAAPTRTAHGNEQAAATVIAGVEPEQTSAAPSTSANPQATAIRMTPYATRTRPEPTLTVPEPIPQSTRSVSSNPPPAAEDPYTTLNSDPLLLSDPDLNQLIDLDAEIRRSAVGRPVQIRYREAALNETIAALLASSPDLPYQDVRADLQSNSVTLTGNVVAMGLRVPTVIKGKVLAWDCLPQVAIESVSVGGILTPSLVKDRVKLLIDDAFAWYPADYPLCLEQIVLEEDRTTIYGSVR